MGTATLPTPTTPNADGWGILVRARKTRRLTQKQVADLCGVGQPTYSKWERGEDAPTRDNLKRLSEALGVAYDLLARDAAEITCAKKYS